LGGPEGVADGFAGANGGLSEFFFPRPGIRISRIPATQAVKKPILPFSFTEIRARKRPLPLTRSYSASVDNVAIPVINDLRLRGSLSISVEIGRGVLPLANTAFFPALVAIPPRNKSGYPVQGAEVREIPRDAKLTRPVRPAIFHLTVSSPRLPVS
jgi:hypothetical protein